MATSAQPQISSVSMVGKIEILLQQKPIILQLLRFACIGVLNTALDFIVLYFISSQFSVSSGTRLSVANLISFSAAVIQSYIWNRYWIFNSESAADSVLKNFVRLFAVGIIGVLGMAAVLTGAQYNLGSVYYWIILVGFLFAEVCCWYAFGLHLNRGAQGNGAVQFLVFLLISVVGAGINTGILQVGVKVLPQYHVPLNANVIKFVSKILATFVSLVWNFVGYKLLVFKRKS